MVVIFMPNKLEMELRAVQQSIAEVKKQMKDCVNVKHYEKMQKVLELYYEEEERLLSEIGDVNG